MWSPKQTAPGTPQKEGETKMIRKLMTGVMAATVALGLAASVFGGSTAEASPNNGSCTFYRYNYASFQGVGDSCAGYNSGFTYQTYATYPYYYNTLYNNSLYAYTAPVTSYAYTSP